MTTHLPACHQSPLTEELITFGSIYKQHFPANLNPRILDSNRVCIDKILTCIIHQSQAKHDEAESSDGVTGRPYHASFHGRDWVAG